MTSQIALDLPVASTVAGGEIVECEPGQELLADLAAISSMIPWFGKRHDTHRADVRRPIVYLYARPAVLSTDDGLLCYAASRGIFRSGSEQTPWARLQGLAFAAGLVSSGGGGDYWVRVTGEKESQTARALVRRVSKGVKDEPWMLELAFGLGNDVASARAEAIVVDVQRALQICGGDWKQWGGSGFTFRHLAPIVLAMRWEPAIEAAAILARHGVLPGAVVPLDVEIPRHSLEAMFARHGVLLDEPGPTKTISTIDEARTWDALVDAAFASGQPWAEQLHKIGKLPPSSSVVRALRWVSEQPR